MLKVITGYILFWIICAILWVVNIVKFCFMIGAMHDMHSFNGLFIARIVGIFIPPLGAILAFF